MFTVEGFANKITLEDIWDDRSGRSAFALYLDCLQTYLNNKLILSACYSQDGEHEVILEH